MSRLITSKMHQKLLLRIDLPDFACIYLRSKERTHPPPLYKGSRLRPLASTLHLSPP